MSSSLGREKLIVRITIGPRLAHLCGCDDGMVRVAVVRRGVPVRRIVAARDVITREADPKVHPMAADLETVLAARAGAMGCVVSWSRGRGSTGWRGRYCRRRAWPFPQALSRSATAKSSPESVYHAATRKPPLVASCSTSAAVYLYEYSVKIVSPCSKAKPSRPSSTRCLFKAHEVHLDSAGNGA